MLAPIGFAHASPATWNGNNNDGLWASGGNWSTSSAPGATTGTTNTDIATFNSTGTTVTVDTRNLSGLTFDGGAGSYTFSGGSFVLSSSGTMQLTAAVSTSGQVETISTPITLVANYTINNNSAADVFNIGNITNNNTSASTLNLGGTDTGANTVSGVISDSASKATSVTKNARARGYSRAPTPIAGATTITGGTLKVDSTTGSLNSATALAMNGGNFVWGSTNASGAVTQSTGTVTIGGGANSVIESDETGAGTSTLTVNMGTGSGLTRTLGSTLNFVTNATGGGSTSIADSSALTSNQGVFYNGANYATDNGMAGNLRAIIYPTTAGTTGGDTGAVTVAAGRHLDAHRHQLSPSRQRHVGRLVGIDL